MLATSHEILKCCRGVQYSLRKKISWIIIQFLSNITPNGFCSCSSRSLQDCFSQKKCQNSIKIKLNKVRNKFYIMPYFQYLSLRKVLIGSRRRNCCDYCTLLYNTGPRISATKSCINNFWLNYALSLKNEKATLKISQHIPSIMKCSYYNIQI